MQRSTQELAQLLWPLSHAEDALYGLAQAAGLSPLERGEPGEAPGAQAASAEALGDWIALAAQRHGLEACGVTATGSELSEMLLRGSPGLFYLKEGGLVAVLKAGRGSITLLGPDLRRRVRRRSWLERLLFDAAASSHRPAMRAFLGRLRLPVSTQEQLEDRLLAQRLSTEPVLTGWLLRTAPGRSLSTQADQAGLLRSLAQIGGAYLLSYACGMLALLLLGRGALGGRLDVGWLLGSLLLLFGVVVLRMVAVRAEEQMGFQGGALLRERLLLGALRIDSLAVQKDGIGRILGRILEAESLEWLLAGGGFALLLNGVELGLAAGLLAAVPGGLPLLLLLAGWFVVCLGCSVLYGRRYRTWAAARLELSAQTIESMVGHRTRLVQLPVEEWHAAEDAALANYHEVSQALDRVALLFHAVLPRGFFLLALFGLLPELLSARSVTPGLAVLLWAVLLSTHAFGQLGAGFLRLGGARAAWEHVGPMLAAAAREPAPMTQLDGTAQALPVAPDTPLLRAAGLRYTPPGRSEPLLRECELSIRAGDRLLFQSASGAGKSTLAAILAGLREPSAGLLLLRGLDLKSLGPRVWQKRVALAPQFHDNHILTASLAFNLLLGRTWPPEPADLEEARALCEELGLGPLLARMPSGLEQQVGETGWRLSQGERSRVYLARTLLQRADVILLDESLAALDPQTLRQVAGCLLQRAGALLLIAHP